MKRLIKNAVRLLGFDIRRRRPHHEFSEVEEMGLGHLLVVLFSFIDENEFTFIQIGANDGLANDHLWPFLNARNLRGILVEPQKKPFRVLLERYAHRNTISLHLGAIDVQTGTRTMYRPSDDITSESNAMFLTQLASFDREKTATALKKYARMFQISCPVEQAIVEEIVSTITLTDLMAQHQMKKCDLLIIDTEGYDFGIIKTIDFSRSRPTILVYEHIHLTARDRRACWKLLRSNGYRCAADWMDTVAIQADDLARPLRPHFLSATAAAA
ncbi:MAG: FkbM family methyltransferase [Geminicoccaceae bacterium]